MSKKKWQTMLVNFSITVKKQGNLAFLDISKILKDQLLSVVFCWFHRRCPI